MNTSENTQENIKYNRSRLELEEKACKWWPKKIAEIEAESSIIPILINTQDQFISILTLSNAIQVDSVFDILQASNFSANLFLKHLIVLVDFGSEPLQRLNRDFNTYFKDGSIKYLINGEEKEYNFSSLPATGSLTNKKMKIDIKSLLKDECLNDFYKDLIFLLLFGGNAVDENIANILSKCTVGNMLGDAEELKGFIKQRYIFVSRITGGAKANDLGNAAQTYVVDYLKEKLGNGYEIKSNGSIPGVSHNGRTGTTFDVTIERNGSYVAVEVSFQVTTNSTIERKAGQAKARFDAVNETNNYIAYIIDGAGNFQRESALSTICSYSHCTVAFTKSEFDVLAKFIQEKLG